MSKVEYITPLPKWVRSKKYFELSGITTDAIKAKIRDGVWPGMADFVSQLMGFSDNCEETEKEKILK